jgi:hypothetical protein
MVNGTDRNLVRLASCVAVYRARFGAWPTHARFDPLVLWDIANVLDAPGFATLGNLMELRTERPEDMLIAISVGGSLGVVRYEEVDHGRIPARALEETLRWLPLDVPRELGTEESAMRRYGPVVAIKKADFPIRDDGVSFHVRPTSEAGKTWIARHIDGGLTPEGGISVEPRALERVIDEIEADGLRFGPHEGEVRVDFFPGGTKIRAPGNALSRHVCRVADEAD